MYPEMAPRSFFEFLWLPPLLPFLSSHTSALLQLLLNNQLLILMSPVWHTCCFSKSPNTVQQRIGLMNILIVEDDILVPNTLPNSLRGGVTSSIEENLPRDRYCHHDKPHLPGTGDNKVRTCALFPVCSIVTAIGLPYLTMKFSNFT
jgi:hypothetical protein